MKFTNWQKIAILVVLFAGIIAAHKLIPGEAAMVVSMATTLFGTLFVQSK